MRAAARPQAPVRERRTPRTPPAPAPPDCGESDTAVVPASEARTEVAPAEPRAPRDRAVRREDARLTVDDPPDAAGLAQDSARNQSRSCANARRTVSGPTPWASSLVPAEMPGSMSTTTSSVSWCSSASSPKGNVAIATTIVHGGRRRR